jgi:hypothetical protein
MRIINILSGINGVVAGGAATLDIPVGRRYHALKAYLSATVGGNPSTNPEEIISSARLLVNGVVMRDLTPLQIINIAKLNGVTPDTATGELPFYFSEPWRASVIGEESTSWDMTVQSKFTLEMTFLSTAVAPACVVEAAFDYGRNRDEKGNAFLAIVKQLRFTRSNPAAAVDITDLPQIYPIQRIHLQVSAGTISSLEVWNDTVKVMEGLTVNLNDFWKDYKLVPAGLFSLSAVFDFTQQISDALFVTNQNLNVRPTCSTAGSITAVVEHRAPGYV